jgi:hypothetical protein
MCEHIWVDAGVVVGRHQHTRQRIVADGTLMLIYHWEDVMLLCVLVIVLHGCQSWSTDRTGRPNVW